MSYERLPFLSQDLFELDIIQSRLSGVRPNYYLPHELGFVDDYFQNMVKLQASHGTHLGEAMNQGAETFHDNAPAEALVSDQEVIVNAVKLLRVNINNAKIVGYPEARTPYVTIGTLCFLDFEGDGEEVCYIAGEPNGYRSLNLSFNFTPISVNSPVGDAVLGVGRGQKTGFRIGDKTQPITVLELEQLPWPLQTKILR